jgi:hypothetical protein
MILAGVLALIPARVAAAKGRSFRLWWFYGWMLLIIAIPHALLLRPIDTHREEVAPPLDLRPPMTRCPNCGESVRADSPTCVFCRSQLNS